MQKIVLIRRKQLRGGDVMTEASVLSQTGDVLRVQIKGERKVVEVRAGEVIERHKIFGTRQGQVSVVRKQHTHSPYALVNQL
jgi:hypothetical protein